MSLRTRTALAKFLLVGGLFSLVLLGFMGCADHYRTQNYVTSPDTTASDSTHCKHPHQHASDASPRE